MHVIVYMRAQHHFSAVSRPLPPFHTMHEYDIMENNARKRNHKLNVMLRILASTSTYRVFSATTIMYALLTSTIFAYEC